MERGKEENRYDVRKLSWKYNISSIDANDDDK